jgi:hypothetical protein
VTARIVDVAGTILSRSTQQGDCLILAGCDNGGGYQNIAGDYGHRHIYRRFHGPIAPGMEIDHLCFQPACVNPDHLEQVTHAENVRRAMARKTACVRGHDLPAFTPGQNRPCRECHRINEAARKARIRAGERPPTIPREDQHGTVTGYGYGCRCDDCRKANRLKGAARRWALGVPTRYGPPPQPIKHGTLHAYSRRGCRCDLCREANTAAARLRRASLGQEPAA